MKKIIFPLLCFALVSGCNNSSEKKSTTVTKDTSQSAVADSLEKEVMDGHDVGMSKYSKLKSLKFRAEQMLDSISKLPEKARTAAAPAKVKLDSLVADLNNAKESMDKWMSEFNMDSAIDNMGDRIRYLTNEKLKVSEVKNNILKGLEKADSILRARF